eukprot:TRINITY_DN61814_c0_g1_i1.p1 TRINITY_DN61814_c0_g1~~TRINITY_DN61814_c0_g1_i1.p1  ORF type:complete len:574 (-),score=90.84 TRINITY_DN61814_c0_g1_i1:89-1810(-)
MGSEVSTEEPPAADSEGTQPQSGAILPASEQNAAKKVGHHAADAELSNVPRGEDYLSKPQAADDAPTKEQFLSTPVQSNTSEDVAKSRTASLEAVAGTAIFAKRFLRAIERRQSVVQNGDCEGVEVDDDEAWQAEPAQEEENPSSSEEDEPVNGKGQEVNQYDRRRLKSSPNGDMITALVNSANVVSTSAEEAPLPELKGWVDKATTNWMVGWQRRWLVLKHRQLRWYNSPEDEASHSPLGMLDFDLVQIEVERVWMAQGSRGRANLANSMLCCGPRRPSSVYVGDVKEAPIFRLFPAGSNRAFEMCAESIEDGDRWVSAIVEHIGRADAVHAKLANDCTTARTATSLGKAWWKTSRISSEQFEELAVTGDVLLFRSKGTIPKLIRAVSRGPFDHVGMVIRLSSGGIGILEATGGEGVGVTLWNNFLKNGWHLLYPTLALRRVRCDRRDGRLKDLQTWCAAVIGKPYALSLRKLTQRTSITTGAPGTGDDFFCSQLVADALKVLRVLPRGKASGQYWPATFSAKLPPLECLEDCSFDGEDLVIDFSLGSGKWKDGGTVPPSVAAKRDETTNLA